MLNKLSKLCLMAISSIAIIFGAFNIQRELKQDFALATIYPAVCPDPNLFSFATSITKFILMTKIIEGIEKTIQAIFSLLSSEVLKKFLMNSLVVILATCLLVSYLKVRTQPFNNYSSRTNSNHRQIITLNNAIQKLMEQICVEYTIGGIPWFRLPSNYTQIGLNFVQTNNRIGELIQIIRVESGFSIRQIYQITAWNYKVRHPEAIIEEFPNN